MAGAGDEPTPGRRRRAAADGGRSPKQGGGAEGADGAKRRAGAPRAAAAKAARTAGTGGRRAAGAARTAAHTAAGVPRAAVGAVTGPPRALAGHLRPDEEPDQLTQDALEVAGGADHVTGPSPFVGFGVRDVLGGLRLAGTQAVRQPVPLVRALPGTGAELARIGLGKSDPASEKRDKRFRDPAWDNRISRRLVQAYLELGSGVDGFVEHSKLEGDAAERARFALGLVRDALAPSNYFLTNPQALKETVKTKGGSVPRGVRHWASDLVRRRGMPSQVDTTPFAVGENLAVTPGAVVHRTPVYELIQYAPQTEEVYETPLLAIPPQVNKYYAMDLRPGRSMFEYLLQHGLQLFVISWRNPTPAERDWGFETYIEALIEASDVVRAICGSDKVNAMGGCAGGVMITILAAYLEAIGDDRMNAVSTLVTLLDTESDAQILMFATPNMIAQAKRASAKTGVLKGQQMGRVFAWLRPNDLVWNYWVNNYLLGKDPPAFDILAWNADTTRLPARFHHDLLDFVSANSLVHPGSLEILGVAIDASLVRCDNYHVAGMTDHITPWPGCYRTTQIFGGNSEFVLCSSGHIQTLVASLDNRRLAYYVNDETPPDPDAWLETATRHEGSWWPHWAQWLGERSGELIDGPSELGDGDHPPQDPAPGRYVRQ